MGFVSKKRGNLASRLCRHRKCQIDNIYFFIFEALAVLAVALVLFQYVNNVATDLGFEKRYTSFDLGLLSTAVSYAPGTLKHTYVPVDFGVPMDIIFSNNLVDVKERGKELDSFYWFLSDMGLEPLDSKVELSASKANDSFTYYKTGRQIDFDKKDVHALKLVCPVLNTTDAAWKSKKIFIAKILPKKEDYSDMQNPVNRIAQILSARYPNIEVSGTSTGPVAAGGSLISAIPSDANIVIALGDSGQKREPGSLVAYVPSDSILLRSRKLACFMLNDLLTPETTVFYVQVMPVYLDSINQTSPLRVFKERSTQEQAMVFLDISTFKNDQVYVDTAANAMYRGIERFYGGYDIRSVTGATFNYIATQPVTQALQPQQAATDLFGATANGWAMSKQPAPPAVNGIVNYPSNTLHNTHKQTLTEVNAGAFSASRCYLGGKKENGLCPGVSGTARNENGKCTCDVYEGGRARSKTEFRSGFDEWKKTMPKPTSAPTFTKDNLVITYYDIADGDAACKGLDPADCNDINKCSAKCRQRGCNYGSTVSCWEAFYYDTLMEGTAEYKGKYYSYKGGILKDGKLGKAKNLFFQPHLSLAVNPNVGQAGYIPWGSRVYIDFKADDKWDGWYIAEDTGGAFECCPKIDVFVGKRGTGHPSTGQGFDIWVFPPIDTKSTSTTAPLVATTQAQSAQQSTT